MKFDFFYLNEPITCPCGLKHEEFYTYSFDGAYETFFLTKDNQLEVENYIFREAQDFEKNPQGFPVQNKEILGYSILKDYSGMVELHNSCRKGLHGINYRLYFTLGKIENTELDFIDLI